MTCQYCNERAHTKLSVRRYFEDGKRYVELASCLSCTTHYDACWTALWTKYQQNAGPNERYTLYDEPVKRRAA